MASTIPVILQADFKNLAQRLPRAGRQGPPSLEARWKGVEKNLLKFLFLVLTTRTNVRYYNSYTCKRRIVMTKRKLPAVSPAETEILRIVWQLDKATVQNVCNRLPAKRKITYATVQTQLRRLEKKGYLKHQTKGKAHVFFAAVDSGDVIKRSVGDFLDKLFGGDPVPLMQYLAEHGKINADDIEKLKQLVSKD